MEKEDIVMLAQLLHAMREITDKLQEAMDNKDFAMVTQAKRELTRLQTKVRDLL